jgi:hypothetical protein
MEGSLAVGIGGAVLPQLVDGTVDVLGTIWSDHEEEERLGQLQGNRWTAEAGRDRESSLAVGAGGAALPQMAVAVSGSASTLPAATDSENGEVDPDLSFEEDLPNFVDGEFMDPEELQEDNVHEER